MNLPKMARVMHLPFFPLTPAFPWLPFPLWMTPLPVKWFINIHKPIKLDYPPEKAHDRKLVREIAKDIQYDIQRTDWIAIDIEYINNSDTSVTSPAKFIGKERPMTNKWNIILNTLATKNDDNWLSFKLFDNENEVSERSIEALPRAHVVVR